MTRIRRDKDWSTATTLSDLRTLFEKKPESVDFGLLLGTSAYVSDASSEGSTDVSPKKFRNVKRETYPVKDEPSTSFEIKIAPSSEDPKIKKESPSLSEGSHRKRKNEERDETFAEQDELKKKKVKTMKREIKGTEDPSVVRIKKEESEIEGKKSRDPPFVDDVKAFEFSKDFDSDFEDEVSNAGALIE